MVAQVVPVKETYQIEVVFQLESRLLDYVAQPYAYWGEVLGDEGPASLIHGLRERGWASSVEAGVSHEQSYQNSLFFLFTIQLTLTRHGYLAWRDLLHLLFAYINTCVAAGPQRHLWDQYGAMANASWEWAEPKEPGETVELLAYAMQRYPWADVLAGPALWQRYDPDLIAEVGRAFTPSNSLILLLSPFDGATATEPWFETSYRATSLSAEFLASLTAASDTAFRLPTPSSLIPASFALVDRPADIEPAPRVIFQDERLRLWHLIESQHVTPRAHVSIRFYTGAVYATASAATCARLLIILLEDALMTYLYEGEVADLTMTMRATRRGLEFQADGFTDRLFEFIAHLLIDADQSLLHVTFGAARFSIIKERLQVAWRSAFFAPGEQVRIPNGLRHGSDSAI